MRQCQQGGRHDGEANLIIAKLAGWLVGEPVERSGRLRKQAPAPTRDTNFLVGFYRGPPVGRLLNISWASPIGRLNVAWVVVVVVEEEEEKPRCRLDTDRRPAWLG